MYGGAFVSSWDRREKRSCTTKLHAVIVTMSCIRALVQRAAFLLLSFFILCSVVRAVNNYYGPPSPIETTVISYRIQGRPCFIFDRVKRAIRKTRRCRKQRSLNALKRSVFSSTPSPFPPVCPLVKRSATAERGRASSTANLHRVRISFFFSY